MSDPINNNQNNDSGNHSNNDNQQGGYSADYVKSLRDEAASWRTKLRELETKYNELETKVKADYTANTIGKELEKRGVKADPTWVKVEEGMSPEQAVDKFLKDYPHLQLTSDDSFVPKPTKKPMRPNTANSNIENTAVSELDAIKKDPIARNKVRDLYRGLLAQSAKTPLYIK